MKKMIMISFLNGLNLIHVALDWKLFSLYAASNYIASMNVDIW